jgi:hypothetical protein
MPSTLHDMQPRVRDANRRGFSSGRRRRPIVIAGPAGDYAAGVGAALDAMDPMRLSPACLSRAVLPPRLLIIRSVLSPLPISLRLRSSA